MSSQTKGAVLIIDDEPNALKVLSAILSEDGYAVFKAKSVDAAVQIVSNQPVDAVITDLKMPSRDGMQFFEYAKVQCPDVPVIFLTAYGTVESAVQAMTLGAYYYFIKPPDYLKLKSMLARAIEQRNLKREVEVLRQRIAEGLAERTIVGNNLQMMKIFEMVEALKDSPSSVLISGETGTGKELIARALHDSDLRREKPFVTVNCAAIPRELMESELFGFEKGSFTGAHAQRIGKIEEASSGTLFLDEIGELEIALQVKLLRVLQEREIERIGSNKKIKVDFRLVSSTNRNLAAEVQAGHFREDLFYRINVVHITVPPLRERRDDIPLLTSHFLREFCIRENKFTANQGTLNVSDEVMRAFQDYHWPGNIRQLRNVIERAVVLARGETITLRELPEEFQNTNVKKSAYPRSTVKTLRELEAQVIRDVLSECKGNKSKAVRILGISRKSLYKKLREIGYDL